MIERMQLTRYMEDHMQKDDPSPFDSEYFDFERISTSLSSGICTYGYRDKTEVAPGHYKLGPWIKKDKIKEEPNA